MQRHKASNIAHSSLHGVQRDRDGCRRCQAPSLNDLLAPKSIVRSCLFLEGLILLPSIFPFIFSTILPLLPCFQNQCIWMRPPEQRAVMLQYWMAVSLCNKTVSWLLLPEQRVAFKGTEQHCWGARSLWWETCRHTSGIQAQLTWGMAAHRGTGFFAGAQNAPFSSPCVN